jgi:hypothetical protein
MKSAVNKFDEISPNSSLLIDYTNQKHDSIKRGNDITTLENVGGEFSMRNLQRK